MVALDRIAAASYLVPVTLLLIASGAKTGCVHCREVPGVHVPQNSAISVRDPRTASTDTYVLSWAAWGHISNGISIGFNVDLQDLRSCQTDRRTDKQMIGQIDDAIPSVKQLAFSIASSAAMWTKMYTSKIATELNILRQLRETYDWVVRVPACRWGLVTSGPVCKEISDTSN